MSAPEEDRKDLSRRPLDSELDVESRIEDDRFTLEEEKRLVRKLDWRILPLTCLLYLFAYLDRSNLGNARLQGLPEDTLPDGDPTGVYFDWVNTAFFFSYILCQVPATVGSKLVPPRVWMAGATLGWGLASTLMSTAWNLGSLVAARVFLGVFEAAFGPAIPLYFSLFYTSEEMGLRMAYWFGFAAIAGAFGGLIAFGVQHADIAISTWRLLFIVEGLPTVLLALFTLLYLPNRPESTQIFNERERRLALARAGRRATADHGQQITKAHIWLAFTDWRVWVGGVIYFGLNNSLASVSAFLPTILTTLGYTNALAQLLTVPPYAVAALVLTCVAYTSDRLQSRGIAMTLASAVGGVGYLILLTVPDNTGVRYFATFCITSGTYTTIAGIIAWYAHNLGTETKKAVGIPMFMAIGQCGSILGSHIFPKIEGPTYRKGFAVSCALEFLAALCCLILSISYRVENKRRDKKHGVPSPHEQVDTRVLADKAHNFRYVV